MTRPAAALVAFLLVPATTWGTTQATAAPVTAWQPGSTAPAVAPDSQPVPRWLPPVASVIVPGSGQLLSGRDRGVIYLAAEILLLTRFFAARSEGRRERTQFRSLAFGVARAPFEPTVRDTVFEYFEQVARFAESGPFDADPGPGFVPPTDEETYNGQIWTLARETFFADPDNPPDPESEEFLRALEFYRSRAVGPNFAWSWRNAALEQDLYRLSMRQSDAAFRRATQQLGVMLVNHLLSAVDAFISQRLSGRRRATVQSLIWESPEDRPRLEARLALGLTF